MSFDVARRGSKGASPAGESHGSHPEDDLVEQARVVELPHEVAAADEPEVRAGEPLCNRVMHRADVSLDEGDLGVGDGWELAAREDPAGPLAVVAAPGVRTFVLEHPLVGGPMTRPPTDGNHSSQNLSSAECGTSKSQSSEFFSSAM
jgi:hypothetical protein